MFSLDISMTNAKWYLAYLDYNMTNIECFRERSLFILLLLTFKTSIDFFRITYKTLKPLYKKRS